MNRMSRSHSRSHDSDNDDELECGLQHRKSWKTRRRVSPALPRSMSPGLWTARRFWMTIVSICLSFLLLLSIVKRVTPVRYQQTRAKLERLMQPSTLVFDRMQLRRVWEWEVSNGHYSSRNQIPEIMGLHLETSYHSRSYLSIRSNGSFPTRPPANSAADFDIIAATCDVDTGKYVRDCLHDLRVGSGLEPGGIITRGRALEYLYMAPNGTSNTVHTVYRGISDTSKLVMKPKARWESPLRLTPTSPSRRMRNACDVEHPRIFHMFWTGPFTDRPYLTLLSFLFTQNLGLHETAEATVCTPQLWVWMDPGTMTHHDAAREEMEYELRRHPWSSPFLHSRFREHIKFKLWNTTEQLDALAELKNEWRSHPIMNSLGHDISQATGKTKLSTILSDLVRFVVLHRFGGIYVDSDVLFLRDWEELWGTRSAFSYRWSIYPLFNTAVLRMHKGSALGSFILRTALRNEFDFHPHTISRYLKDAYLEELLPRLPDALFDPHWLHADGAQTDRPPQPAWAGFEGFAETPMKESIQPLATGFDGFFRGAYAYHHHIVNGMAFDPARNWPDLGPRFQDANLSAVEEWQYSQTQDRDIGWAAVLKRTFESYLRGDRPNMYGERLQWDS